MKTQFLRNENLRYFSAEQGNILLFAVNSINLLRVDETASYILFVKCGGHDAVEVCEAIP